MAGSNPTQKLDKEAYIRGIQAAMLVDTADQSYLQGLEMGSRLARQRYYAMKELDVNVDAELWMKNFRKTSWLTRWPTTCRML